MNNSLIIIPTYNEAENVEILIPRLFQHIPNISILIVDDASPDGTADKCDSMRAKFPQLFIERRQIGRAHV